MAGDRETEERLHQVDKRIAEREKRVDRYVKELDHERECFERHNHAVLDRQAAKHSEAASHKQKMALLVTDCNRDTALVAQMQKDIAATKDRTQDIRNAVR